MDARGRQLRRRPGGVAAAVVPVRPAPSGARIASRDRISLSPHIVGWIHRLDGRNSRVDEVLDIQATELTFREERDATGFGIPDRDARLAMGGEVSDRTG
jgi:hypothetical protein